MKDKLSKIKDSLKRYKRKVISFENELKIKTIHMSLRNKNYLFGL